jgi:hypothetical protein
MMKKIIVILAMLVTSTVYADCQSNLGINFPANQKNTLCTNFSSAVSLDQAFTGIAQEKYPVAGVITPATAATAVAAAPITARHNVIAAGAPTAAFVQLPAVTANVGKQISVFNQGSNPVAIVPSTGVINVSAALTPFSCPSG